MGGFCGVIGRLEDIDPGALGSALALPASRGVPSDVRGDWFAVRACRRNEEASWALGEEWLAFVYGYVTVPGGSEGSVCGPQARCEPARAFLEWFLEAGPEAFGRARGQWSVVLIHRAGRRALFAKDYLGTRPLFWRRGPRRLWFSTEPGPLWNVEGGWTPSRRQLAAYLRPDPPMDRTVVEEVRRVPPGAVCSASAADVVGDGPSPLTVLRNHWAPQLSPPRHHGRKPSSQGLREAMSVAIRRAMPDGPFGVAFSGGVDSTTVLALSATHAVSDAVDRVRPLSLRFPKNPRCDESAYRAPVNEVLGLRPIELDIETALTLDDLRQLYDRIHSPAFPNVPLIARLFSKAAAEGLPVVLTGMGGDHVLDGHPVSLADLLGAGRWTEGLALASRLWREGSVWTPRIAKYLLEGLLAAAFPASIPAGLRLRASRSSYPTNTREKQVILAALDRERRLYHFDAQAELSEELGIEVRDPLFDRDLVDLVLGLEPGDLMLGGSRRGMARASLAGVLSRETYDRDGKTDLTEVSEPVWTEWGAARRAAGSRIPSLAENLESPVGDGPDRTRAARDVAALEVFFSVKLTGARPPSAGLASRGALESVDRTSGNA